LKQGWLRSAMLTGTIPLQNNMNLDLGVGMWSPTIATAFDLQHNSHIHISLSLP
jgi:hypothetical protein